MENFLEAVQKYSNDYDLGEYLREKYQNNLNAPTEVLEMIKAYPNNYKLGEAARSNFLNS